MLMRVVYPLPDTGRIDIRLGVGVDCFIFLSGVWRCLNCDKADIVPRFFFTNP